MRELVTIQTIKEVLPIEGADAIELITFEDVAWRCVAKKGEFVIGDKALYFEIDSLLPQIPQFEFLAARGTKKMTIGNTVYEGYRLKTIKLRGQISQGLALPISAFDIDLEGDLQTQIGVVKYERDISNIGEAKGNFPSFLQKTGETRIQVQPHLFTKYPENIFYGTIKYDGSSMTCYKHNEEFGVCSRNLTIKEGGKFFKMAQQLGLDKNLPDGFAVQGEYYGKGVQKNVHNLEGVDYIVFNVYSILAGRYLNRDEMVEFCHQLNLNYVKVYCEIQLKDHNVDSLLRLADETGLEGLVFRPYEEIVDNKIGRLSFKVISNKFLLKN